MLKIKTKIVLIFSAATEKILTKMTLEIVNFLGLIAIIAFVIVVEVWRVKKKKEKGKSFTFFLFLFKISFSFFFTFTAVGFHANYFVIAAREEMKKIAARCFMYHRSIPLVELI